MRRVSLKNRRCKVKNPYSKINTGLLEPRERLSYLIDGYFRDCIVDSIIPIDITKIIHLNLCILPGKSSRIVSITHSIVSAINDYLTLPENKCPFANDFNILDHIYIRGGALRDCYLLRDINDVDIVLDSHTLSKLYLLHLTTYHSTANTNNQLIHKKCIFYRRYMNKFDTTHPYVYHNYQSYMEPFHVPSGSNKITRFLADIANSNWMINTRFLIDILAKEKQFNEKYKYRIIRKHRTIHWKLTVSPKNDHEQNRRNPINQEKCVLDIVSGPEGWYCLDINGLRDITELFSVKDVVDDALSKIKEYEMSHSSLHSISVPIYPFPFDLKYYDFTINTMHISLAAVLKAGKYSNWTDLASLRYQENAINKYNVIALQDLRHKILRAVSYDCMTIESAEHFFWRFVKIGRKLYQKIEKNIWKVDEKYINKTVKYYKIWFRGKVFNEKWSKSRMKTARRQLLTKIFDSQERNHKLYEVLHIFRFIGFETLLKKQFWACPQLRMDFRKKFTSKTICTKSRNCLQKFGYGRKLSLAPPKTYCFACEQFGSHLHIQDFNYVSNYCVCCKSYDCIWYGKVIEEDVYGMEDAYGMVDYNSDDKLPKRCNRYEGKSWSTAKSTSRWKSKNRNKVKSYSQRKKDKQSLAKSNKKYKDRYMSSLQMKLTL
eukprot:289173_1